jgi:ABC-type glucose/galactose transport system permease subunit
VRRIKVSVYMLCSLMAGLSALLVIGWLGSVTNALGLTYELRVIASSVIGGTNLMGGEGTAYGSVRRSSSSSATRWCSQECGFSCRKVMIYRYVAVCCRTQAARG